MRAAMALTLACFAGLAPAVSRAGPPAWRLDQNAALPAPYSFATSQDALAAIFPTYSSKSGTVQEVRTQAGKPAHVGILEAKPWYANGSHYLVVIAANEFQDGEYGSELCGGCGQGYKVAVLIDSGNGLKLLARVPDENTAPDRIGLGFWVKGDGDVSLDLAPFKLTDKETLLGVRLLSSVPGAYFAEDAQLFRLRDGRLNLVAQIETGCCRGGDPVDQATIEVVPGPGSYNDLVVVTRRLQCARGDEGFTCSNPKAARQLGPPKYSMFRFYGNVYRQLGHRQPPDLF